MNLDKRLGAAFEDLAQRVRTHLATDRPVPITPPPNRPERRRGSALGRVAAAFVIVLLIGGPLWLSANDDSDPTGVVTNDGSVPERTLLSSELPEASVPETTAAQVTSTPNDSLASSTTPTLAGPPPAGRVITLEESGSFVTPSSNIACGMSVASGVFCWINEKDWEVRQPLGCENDWGNVIDLGPSGVTWGCYSDVFWDLSADPLPYGDGMVVGAYRCDSARTGVTCRDGRGRSFTLSRTAVTIEPPPVTDAVFVLELGPTGLGSGLGSGLGFGADGDAVTADLSAVFGPPGNSTELDLVPLASPSPEYAWGDADDGLGFVSSFPHVRLTCWPGLCQTDVSSDGTEWTFSGWESTLLPEPNPAAPKLATAAGLTVGDGYERLLDLYPGVTIGGGEGGSVGFQLPGWPEAGDGAVVGNGRLGISLVPFDDDLVPGDTPIQSLFSSDGSTSYGCC